MNIRTPRAFIEHTTISKIHSLKSTRIYSENTQHSTPELHLPQSALIDKRIIFATSGAPMHDWPGHAECAERVPAILQALETYNLSQNPNVIELDEFYPATLDDIFPIHNAKYMQGFERVSSNAQLQGISGTLVDSSPTYVTQTTYKDALRAAGAAMSLIDHIVISNTTTTANTTTTTTTRAKSLAGFGICRPPGHHAIPASAMGFCLLNNAAIAARHAQRVHGLKKVAIFDWDVHHGNGTQDVFENDPSVLFISTHQDNSYPGTGKIGEVGQGDGQGYTINVPLPGDSGHNAALASWETIVEPALRRFKPDLIIVSAGYDAHLLDPLAGLQYRSGTYHTLSTLVAKVADEVCDGRLLFLLEGGYHLQALGESVASTFAGVLGEKAIDPIDPSLFRDEPGDKIKAALAEAKRIHDL